MRRPHTIEETAEILGVVPAQVLHEIRRGRLKADLVDSAYFISTISMQYWQAEYGDRQATSPFNPKNHRPRTDKTGSVIASK
jgi:hypothetical protein